MKAQKAHWLLLRWKSPDHFPKSLDEFPLRHIISPNSQGFVVFFFCILFSIAILLMVLLRQGLFMLGMANAKAK